MAELFGHLRRALDTFDQIMLRPHQPLTAPKPQAAVERAVRYPLCPPDGLKLAYTVNEVRKLVGVSTATNYKLLGSGALKAVKLGNRTLVLAKDLRDWLERLPPRRRQLAKFLNLQ